MRNAAFVIATLLAVYLSWNAIASYEGMIWIYVLALGSLGAIKYIEHIDNRSRTYTLSKDRYIIVQASVVVIATSLSIIFLGHAMTP